MARDQGDFDFGEEGSWKESGRCAFMERPEMVTFEQSIQHRIATNEYMIHE